MSRQYGASGVSLSRDYERSTGVQINKENGKTQGLGLSSLNNGSNAASYSRIPGVAQRENQDYGKSSAGSGSIHTTRVPPQMKPGLSHKSGYDYQQSRENSNGRLPQIDVTFKNYKNYVPSTSSQVKYPHTSTHSEYPGTALHYPSANTSSHHPSYHYSGVTSS